MTPNEVLEHMKKIFPHMFDGEYVWFPHGRDSVRVRSGKQREVIFTYLDKGNWMMETADHYFERLKGEKNK